MVETPEKLVDPLLTAVLEGLSRPQKALPPTLFYDAVGSELFLRITELDEYYVTRAEAEILRDHAAEIAAVVGSGADRVVVIEPGCGAATKVGALLRHWPEAAYFGIDVSAEALSAGIDRVAREFPRAIVHGFVADYHAGIALPGLPSGRRVAFFPGSTIGNFDPDDATAFLAGLRGLVGPAGRALIGVDLWKDPAVLRAAYDDREGVTAAFDKNALAHLNARYQADFDLDRFDHLARVDARLRRVEMHLRSVVDHSVHVAGTRFRLGAGETIHTENAYKYSVDGFEELARGADLVPIGRWTDGQSRFAIFAFGVQGAL